jgi:hypothetical protein
LKYFEQFKLLVGNKGNTKLSVTILLTYQQLNTSSTIYSYIFTPTHILPGIKPLLKSLLESKLMNPLSNMTTQDVSTNNSENKQIKESNPKNICFEDGSKKIQVNELLDLAE